MAPTPTNPAFSFSDAPGGDLRLEDLFPSESAVPQPTTASTEEPSAPTPQEPQEPVAQPVVPAPQTPEEFYLRAGETVYKSKEDAERGIAHKDALLQELRLREIARTGVDPFTNQPMHLGSQTPQAPVEPNYAQDNKKFYEDLVGAVEANDPQRYAAVQQKFVMDLLEPLAPVITEMSKERAVKSVSNEIKDLPTFLNSPEYESTLNAEPALKQAIQIAESDYRMQNQLPGLYKLSYWVSQGRRLPELLRAAQAPPQAPPVPQARPLTAPSTPPAPAANSNPPGLNTHEGRQELIRQAEARGIANMKW